MNLFTGCLAAGLVLGTAGAQAQMLAPYEAGHSPYARVSDIGGPYVAAVPGAPGAHYGYGPRLLPPQEVYTVLRESGFSPLGIPRQRGFVYAIEVIDRRGESGQLIVDARDGRIVRFRPGYQSGNNFNEDLTVIEGPQGAPPPAIHVGAVPRPPRSIPHVASRAVPVPKASPLAGRPEGQPAQQQSAATQSKPAEVPAALPAVTTGQAPAKPVAEIAPTKDMPKVQGLE
jgi:hypothetical protein